jgi:hypothetical protein
MSTARTTPAQKPRGAARNTFKLLRPWQITLPLYWTVYSGFLERVARHAQISAEPAGLVVGVVNYT